MAEKAPMPVPEACEDCSISKFCLTENRPQDCDKYFAKSSAETVEKVEKIKKEGIPQGVCGVTGNIECAGGKTTRGSHCKTCKYKKQQQG